MPVLLKTIKDINRANSCFWRGQRELLKSGMANDAIRETAFESLQAQQLQGISIYRWTSLEQALEVAARVG
jgi:hypothetical protein